jgi:hypothetical protein
MPSMPMRRPPRAGVDPITDAPSAWALVQLARHWPPRPETIAIVLDAHRRGRVLLVVSGMPAADDVVPVARFVAVSAARHGPDQAFVLASLRPGVPLGPDDVRRWEQLSALCHELGVTLVEWFVDAGDSGTLDLSFPRQLAGDPPRWAVAS